MDVTTEFTQVSLNANGILTISLNRPDKLNALTHPVLAELDHIFTDAKINPKVTGLIITGNGKAFCAGADIHRLFTLDTKQAINFSEYGQSVFRKLETCTKPSIAAINGYCFGGGCELAMSTHLRIASNNALFGQPEVKLGVIPGYGGTQRLARLVGKGRAIDLCITGRQINAQTALDWGLITDIVSPDTLLAKAEEKLLTVLHNGPTAVALALTAIDEGYDLALVDAFRLETKCFALSCASAQKQEGVSAFLEKRPAHFKPDQPTE